MKRFLGVSVVLAVLIPAVAFALDLQSAKNQRLVGETPSGYLAPVSSAPAEEVRALVNDINGKRRAEYSRIAKESGTSVSAVERLAAQKAIDKTPSGQMIQLPSGEWQQK